MKFSNGINFVPLIRKLQELGEKDYSKPNLDVLIDSNDSKDKVHNWRIIAAALVQLEIKISFETVTLIIAGETELIVKVIKYLYKAEQQLLSPKISSRKLGTRSLKKTKVGPDGALYIETVDKRKPLTQSET